MSKYSHLNVCPGNFFRASETTNNACMFNNQLGKKEKNSLKTRVHYSKKCIFIQNYDNFHSKREVDD